MSRRRPYWRSMAGWWRRNPRHLRYLIREGTSLFVGAYAALLVWGLSAIAAGPDAWERWLGVMRQPLMGCLHLLIFFAACWHSVTWFAVAPKTMPPLKPGGRPLSSRALVAMQYLMAALVSALILCGAGTGR